MREQVTCDNYHWSSALGVVEESGRQAPNDAIRQRCERISLLIRQRASGAVEFDSDDAKWLREHVGPVETVKKRDTKAVSDAARRLRRNLESGTVSAD